MSSNGRATNHRMQVNRHFGAATVNTAAEKTVGRIRELSQGENGSRRVLLRENGESVLGQEDRALNQSEIAHAPTITVLVADDHPVVREGLIALINRQPNMRVIAEAGDGREAVEKFAMHRPDVALLDLRMSIMDGIEAVISICEKDPTAHVAIITSYQSEEDIYRALRAGAQGYLLKDITAEELAQCIRALAEGKTWIPPQVGAKLARRLAEQQLTGRETDVLRAVAAGKSNKEIGVALKISEATVKVHVTHILEKLKVTGRTEAINVAVKRGLVRLDGDVAA